MSIYRTLATESGSSIEYDMRKNRQQNPASFITGTIAKRVRCREAIYRLVLGIDECMNNETHIGSLCRRLISGNIVNSAIPLWYQQRQDSQGRCLMVLGSSLSPMPPQILPDTARAVRGFSWPDENVVTWLVAYFVSADRLCLLTQNSASDKGGLRRILDEEVGPALESLSPPRIGLLVLCKSAGTTLAEYAKAVEHRLRHGEVSPGYRWELTGSILDE